MHCVQVLSARFRASLSINACTHDTSSIASAFTTRKKTLYAYMLQRLFVSHDAHWRRSPRLHRDHHRLVSQKSVGISAKHLKTLLQAMRDHLRQPEVQRTRYQSWRIRRLGQVVTQLSIHKIRHPLRWCRLLHISLLPTHLLQLLLKPHHPQRIPS